jgi:hypothetical protein
MKMKWDFICRILADLKTFKKLSNLKKLFFPQNFSQNFALSAVWQFQF